jgi:hypothetical protein
VSAFQAGLAVFGFVVGAMVLALSIHRLVRLLKESVIHRLPMMEEQPVQLMESGPVILHLEGPRMIQRMVGPAARLLGKKRFEFSLRNAATGLEAPSHRIVFHSRTKGVSKARISLMRFDVEGPGEHVLIAHGLAADADPTRMTLLLTRPYQLHLVLLILATVVGANLLLFSVLFPLIRILGG